MTPQSRKRTKSSTKVKDEKRQKLSEDKTLIQVSEDEGKGVKGPKQPEFDTLGKWLTELGKSRYNVFNSKSITLYESVNLPFFIENKFKFAHP